MSQIQDRSKKALLHSARTAAPSVAYDERGYTGFWLENLMPGLPFSLIEADLASGAGGELGGKLCAAHSSAALAVNCFGYWKDRATEFPIEPGNSTSVLFEGKCPTGLNGTPPHLDLLAIGNEVLGIESKCTEWMSSKRADFADSYDTLAGRWYGRPWFELIKECRAEPARYAHLDVAQLVKHALGLMNCYPQRKTSLLYLYWEPLNATEWRACAKHREEIADLQTRVVGADVKLRSMSYPELLQSWNADVLPEAHFDYLRRRYMISV